MTYELIENGPKNKFEIWKFTLPSLAILTQFEMGSGIFEGRKFPLPL